MRIKFFLGTIFLGFLLIQAFGQEQKPGTIDRKKLVQRHNLRLTDVSEAGPTQVGNGNFAYGFDITGMQTFNDQFTTMSQWSWHSTPPPKGMKPSDFKQTFVNTHGRMVGYDLPDPHQAELTQWLSSNPHRFNLGRIGLILKKEDGSTAQPDDLQHPVQYLDLWTGIAESNFTVEGQKVKVTTICDPAKDILSFKIESDLIPKGRLGVFLDFPYASLDYFSNGSDYKKPLLHQTSIRLKNINSVIFDRHLDSTTYQVACKWSGSGSMKKQSAHRYSFYPGKKDRSIEYVFAFSPDKTGYNLPSFAEIKAKSAQHWPAFWKSGAAIDLSQSKDPRWFELERRIILSEYVMAINAAGNFPPQETGLVNNSWYGRFHYEMYWWHAAHYALWDRWPLLNKSLHVYSDNLASSLKRAELQGYAGARWPKCTGPDGREWPDNIHAWLIWQQPHPIFFAELDYRAHPGLQTLKKWDKIIEKTADFLASYAFLDTARKQYVLGPPIKAVPENNEGLSTQNPAFELAYWRYGLQTAQQWKKKLKLLPKPEWEKVLKNLAPIPVKDSLYEQWEGVDNMWTKFNFEHPAMAGIFGVLPGNGADRQIMEKTYQKIQAVWKYDTGWGWDFPMMAMTAARLGHKEQAVDMLLHPSKKFGFDKHGFVGGGNPFPYIPTNGGLLYAIAFMTAGWDGDKNNPEPGWPKDGSWVVKWEGFKKAP
ncbi:hypothetical protein DBR11_06895 [Pedobacter sp. HMWF019]|uniref:hypothetical protein n=1 Tax=Pedobacter sp. HMWF019 TaxID=2056856 RepID=UPI000D38BE21|nr:hypothetical protein [Pedobacter sp. HMWF019]PTT01629.1 hypothetical protein DBR11_06895 [Pedobacter sp. HMWF019]